jgi:hypothetical protein
MEEFFEKIFKTAHLTQETIILTVTYSCCHSRANGNPDLVLMETASKISGFLLSQE